MFNGEIETDSVLAVKVFYSTGSYTKITEKPALELKDLIPNVGGTLGLFLGIGVLSFVEIIEILIEILYSCMSKIKPVKKIDPKESKKKSILKN